MILYEQLLATLSERTPIKVKAETEAITIEQIMDKVTEYIEKLQVAMFQKLYGSFLAMNLWLILWPCCNW